MKRLRIVNKKRFISSISILIIMIISILNCVFAKSSIEYQEYTVVQGDTLWSIASENKKAGQDIREYIYELREINNMNDCLLYPNQTITIIK